MHSTNSTNYTMSENMSSKNEMLNVAIPCMRLQSKNDFNFELNSGLFPM